MFDSEESFWSKYAPASRHLITGHSFFTPRQKVWNRVVYYDILLHTILITLYYIMPLYYAILVRSGFRLGGNRA